MGIEIDRARLRAFGVREQRTHLNVYSYFEDVGMDQREIIELWAESWRKHGWNPVMLDQWMGSRHKDWVSFNAGRIHALPTKNPFAYERACWRRWFALAAVGGGVMVDYDVINVGLKPEDVILNKVMILDVHRVPCAVAVDAEGAREVVDYIMQHKPNAKNGHYSDMLMFIENLDWPHIKVCKELDHPERKLAKLVHCSTRACKVSGFPNKVDAIKSIT